MRFVGPTALVLACATCRFEPRLAEPVDDAPGGDAFDAPPDAERDAGPCPAPPGGCTGFSCGDNNCYYVCTSGTWIQSRDKCVDQGLGCLVTINSALENECIHANTNPVFPDLPYLGLYQPIGSGEPRDGWTWQCGASSYAPDGWLSPGNEPNNQGGDEHCGVLAEDRTWNDIDCVMQRRFVCELDR